MKTANDPRRILEALLGTGADELDFAPEQVAQARALARDPAGADAGAVESLPEPLALAVLEAAVRARAVGLCEALAGSSNKALSRGGKKALYRLRSMGVEVGEKKPEAPAAPATAAAQADVPPSLVSAITGNGERALIIGRPVRGRIETLQIVIADEHGVVHLGVNEISRGQYRRMLRDARRPEAPSAVEIPLEEAKALLAEAVGTNLRTKTPFPEGLDAALRHLTITPWEAPRQVPPPEEGDARLAAQGAALHQTREIGQWLPPIDQIRSFSLKAQEIATSALYVDERQRADQLRRTLQSEAERFFTEPIRQLYARRLWLMADVFERSGRPEQAAIARAEARRLFHNAPGLFSPFAVTLFEKLLTLQGPPDAHLQPPAGAPPLPGPPSAETTEPAGGKRSPGGLILP